MTTPAFHPFTKSDFQAYAGVESKNPRICDIDLENNHCLSLTLILDGNRLEASLVVDDDFSAWCMEYASDATAEAVAEAALKLALATLEADDSHDERDACQAIVEKFSLDQIV